LPGAAVPGAETVTAGPRADAHDGAELACDAAALAVVIAAVAGAPVVPFAGSELELPAEQPTSASMGATPHASVVATAFAIPRFLSM
jgi:hypothetical protein